MDAFDLAVLVVAAAAVAGGWRLGFLTRALSWVGLGAGMALASRLLPTVADNLRGDAGPGTRLLLVSGVLVAGGLIGQSLGLVVGATFHAGLPAGRARAVDRGLGGVAGLVGVLVLLWALLPAMANVPGWPAREARNSAVARALHSLTPEPPDTLQTLRRLVGDEQFGRVFKDGSLGPTRAGGPPPAVSGLDAATVARVARSTVKVRGVACQRIQEGSGFATAPGVVVTNAHVVAGEQRTEVVRPDGVVLPARVIQFDPDRDLALLSVAGLDQAPLPVGGGDEGAAGAVFGHPGGQDPLEVSPARVSRRVDALGRDLYDDHDTHRDVLVLASRLRPGDSGGALVDRTGTVIGVAFAIAPDRPDTGYALATTELRPVLARTGAGPTDTGSCIT